MMNQALDVLKMTERLSTAIALRESHFREFKSAIDRSSGRHRPRDLKDLCRDIAETLVSFANADGGELFVGLEDDGTVSGVPHDEDHIVAMSNAPVVYVHEDTPLPGPLVTRIACEDKSVLYFHVAKSTFGVHITSDGRCLQRFDIQNRAVSPEDIRYTRQEQRSREYDRAFVDGARLEHLDRDALDQVSKHIGGGQTPEKFLQFMDLAEFSPDGFRLRRAALLLFARDIARWHPRCQVRIIRVLGNALGVGKDYNVQEDQIVSANVTRTIEEAWDILRPHLARKVLFEAGIFRETLIYPEVACREALTNCIAHRDYSIEGKGVEIFIFDDRLEIRSPGGLLSSVSLDDLRGGKRAHQSRNAYVTRILRELGYMHEMGEGMLRIFATMRELDLVPPDLEVTPDQFAVVLHHRSVFAPKDQEWLRAYGRYNLSRDEQRVVLMGRGGRLLSTQEIMKGLAIHDTDQFRQFVEGLRRKGILYVALDRRETGRALRQAGTKRKVARFGIRPPDQCDQYWGELLDVLGHTALPTAFRASLLTRVVAKLSPSSPFRESLGHSLKLLGLVDERLRPLPAVAVLLREHTRQATTGSRTVSTKLTENEGVLGRSVEGPKIAVQQAVEQVLGGTVARLRDEEGYGFINGDDGEEYFFHRSNLTTEVSWDTVSAGCRVQYERGARQIPGKSPPARNVRIMSVDVES
jgi:ATP-dependent DNA helicase RecG